jgi:hypothetical protein
MESYVFFFFSLSTHSGFRWTFCGMNTIQVASEVGLVEMKYSLNLLLVRTSNG